MKTRLSALVLAVVLSQSTGSAQQLLWKYVYDGSAHSSDEAWPMALGTDENLYAAGWSAGLGTGLDLTVASVTLSGAERWLYRYNGPANRDDAARAIALGQDGNVYAAGVSTGSGGSDDLTIVGLNPNGLERWVYRYDGPAHGRDEACSLVLGNDGCLYAEGWSQGVGTGADFTVVSVDTTGAERWVYRYDGPAHRDDKDSARLIAYGADGNVYAAGWSEGTSSGPDFTVVSLTGSGQERWVYRYDGPGSGRDAAWGVVWCTDGNVCAAGYTTGSGTGFDLTAISLTPAGQERWVYRKATTGRDQAWGIAAGPGGMVYAGGELGHESGSDFVVVAIDSGGQEHWVYRYDGPAGGNDYAGPVHVGRDGNIYAAGKSYGGATDFDLVAACLDTSGRQRWLYRYNGPGNGWDNGETIIYGPDGNTYVAGSITGLGTGQDFAVVGIGRTVQQDVGAVQVLAPTGVMNRGTVCTPRAVVRNFGAQSAVFPVVMQIGSGYARVVQETLAAGRIDTMSFSAWTADPAGTLPVLCYTSLTGDENPENDSVVDSVRVVDTATSDVGVARLLAPIGVVDSGSVLVPSAVVCNFGTSDATFPVAMVIGGSYNQTVSETLAAGGTDTVRFLPWTAEPLGTLPVVCYTALSGDENPANDTVRDSVTMRHRPSVDVGTDAILAPVGTVDSGSNHVPSAQVRNHGMTDAVFPVTLRIGTSYSAATSETLAAGAVDTVLFPVWNASSVGPVALVCFTNLTGDEDPTNDTIRDSVRVVGPPVHDVGTIAILAPTGTLHTGDTIVPRARVTNFGNVGERYFDVRFRIDASYNRIATVVQTLLPDSSTDVTFDPWVATSGYWGVSCSTMLVTDAVRANDKLTASVRACQQARLYIEPDQSDRLALGEGKTYQFHALLEGDSGDVVEVVQPPEPVGWSLQMYDSSANDRLTDTDGDGVPDIGYVPPGTQRSFSLEVKTPSGLVGDTASLAARAFVVAGHLGNDSAVADTALLTLTLVPGFSVHNFPNPLSIRTAFVIGLPGDGKVSLTVYTRAGERVCRVLEREDKSAGVHVVRWEAVNDHGQDVGPGTYEYVLDYVHQGRTDRIRKKLVVAKE